MKFQTRVLELVSKVPRGRVTTYKELARALGNRKACRAVGNALAANPRLPSVPCHRVVRSDGKIGGYKLGSRRKIELLLREGVEVEKGKVDLRKLFTFRK